MQVTIDGTYRKTWSIGITEIGWMDNDGIFKKDASPFDAKFEIKSRRKAMQLLHDFLRGNKLRLGKILYCGEDKLYQRYEII